MQNDAIQAPEDCGSMDELRVAIDALDRQLVTLLARRQTYIERAAELKSGRAQVRDMLLDDGGPFARAAPFTLQRLTELLLWPPPSGVSTHARADKLLVALGRVSAARAQRFAAAAALAACSRLRA